MVNTLQIISLLLYVVVTVTLGKNAEDRKSRLILEFDWPEPKKNLQRFPHRVSCSHFYVIKPDGSQAIKKCPSNELFDYRTLRCHQRTAAKCWSDLLKKGHTKKKVKHFKCPFPWGLFPDTEDCSMFYDCLGGIAYSRKCPDNFLFDKAERTCVEESVAMCADHTDIIEPDYKCPFKWGFFTHSKDCSMYYECLRKIPILRTCKKNMLFDNFNRKCLPMDNVECGERFNPYGDEQVTTKRIHADDEQASTNIPTGREQVTTDSVSSEPKGVTYDRFLIYNSAMTTNRIPPWISTGHQWKTTDRNPSKRQWGTTGRLTSGDERVPTNRIFTGRERVTTDRIPTGRRWETTDHIPSGQQSRTTERISSEVELVTADHISTERIKMTTDRIPTGRQWRTTDHIPTAVTTNRIPPWISTGHQWGTTDRNLSRRQWGTTARIPSGGEWVTTDGIHTGPERVTSTRIPTGRQWGTTDRQPSGQQRETERNSPGGEWFTTDRNATESERVTAGRILTGRQWETTDRISTGHQRGTINRISSGHKKVTTDDITTERQNHIPTRHEGMTPDRSSQDMKG